MKTRALLDKVTPNFLEDYLTACGVNEIKEYLSPTYTDFEDYRKYPNIDLACIKIYRGVENGKKFGIVCDSDVDGILSATICYKFLKNRNVVPKVFIHNSKEHGITQIQTDNILQQVIDAGIEILIVPDAGSNDKDSCMKLQQLGIDVIIADHHETAPDANPYATVVNHHLGEGLNTALSGTGVMFKVIEAYCVYYEGDSHRVYTEYSPHVAISLIGDVCDMIGIENRSFYKTGMKYLDGQKELAILVDKFNHDKAVDPIAFAFGMIPPFNALCRSDRQEDKRFVFEALVGKQDIEEAIKKLKNVVAKQRRDVEKITNKVIENLISNHKVSVGFIENNEATYSGLVANKIVSVTNKPTFILRPVTSTTWSGSLRSPFPIANIINEANIASATGHLQAAGIVCSKAKLDNLLKYLDKHLTNDVVCDTIDVTANIGVNNITTRLCSICQNGKDIWGSSGSGIVEPTFHVTMQVSKSQVNLYRKKTTTLKITAKDVSFIKFKLSDKEVEQIENCDNFTFEAIVTLGINEWNGHITPQAMIKEYEITPKKSKWSNLDWSELF